MCLSAAALELWPAERGMPVAAGSVSQDRLAKPAIGGSSGLRKGRQVETSSDGHDSKADFGRVTGWDCWT